MDNHTIKILESHGLTISKVLQHFGYKVYPPTGGATRATRCPFHNDRHESFVITSNDLYAQCYAASCPMHDIKFNVFTLTKALLEQEEGKTFNDKEVLSYIIHNILGNKEIWKEIRKPNKQVKQRQNIKVSSGKKNNYRRYFPSSGKFDNIAKTRSIWNNNILCSTRGNIKDTLISFVNKLSDSEISQISSSLQFTRKQRNKLLIKTLIMLIFEGKAHITDAGIFVEDTLSVLPILEIINTDSLTREFISAVREQMQKKKDKYGTLFIFTIPYNKTLQDRNSIKTLRKIISYYQEFFDIALPELKGDDTNIHLSKITETVRVKMHSITQHILSTTAEISQTNEYNKTSLDVDMVEQINTFWNMVENILSQYKPYYLSQLVDWLSIYSDIVFLPLISLTRLKMLQNDKYNILQKLKIYIPTSKEIWFNFSMPLSNSSTHTHPYAKHVLSIIRFHQLIIDSILNENVQWEQNIIAIILGLYDIFQNREIALELLNVSRVNEVYSVSFLSYAIYISLLWLRRQVYFSTKRIDTLLKLNNLYSNLYAKYIYHSTYTSIYDTFNKHVLNTNSILLLGDEEKAIKKMLKFYTRIGIDNISLSIRIPYIEIINEININNNKTVIEGMLYVLNTLRRDEKISKYQFVNEETTNLHRIMELFDDTDNDNISNICQIVVQYLFTETSWLSILSGGKQTYYNTTLSIYVYMETAERISLVEGESIVYLLITKTLAFNYIYAKDIGFIMLLEIIYKMLYGSKEDTSSKFVGLKPDIKRRIEDFEQKMISSKIQSDLLINKLVQMAYDISEELHKLPIYLRNEWHITAYENKTLQNIASLIDKIHIPFNILPSYLYRSVATVWYRVWEIITKRGKKKNKEYSIEESFKQTYVIWNLLIILQGMSSSKKITLWPHLYQIIKEYMKPFVPDVSILYNDTFTSVINVKKNMFINTYEKNIEANMLLPYRHGINSYLDKRLAFVIHAKVNISTRGGRK